MSKNALFICGITSILWAGSFSYKTDYVLNSVQYRKVGSEKWVDLPKNGVVYPMYEVRTGNSSYCVLLDQDSNVVMIAENSKVKLNPDREKEEREGGTLIKIWNRSVDVVSGLALFSVAKKPKNHSYSVIHPKGEVVVMGTRFLVEVDTVGDTSTVSVLEGAVGVLPANGDSSVVLSPSEKIALSHETSESINRISGVDTLKVLQQTDTLTLVDLDYYQKKFGTDCTQLSTFIAEYQEKMKKNNEEYQQGIDQYRENYNNELERFKEVNR